MVKRILVQLACFLPVLILSCADYNTLNDVPEKVSLSITGVADSTVTLSWTQYTGTDFKNYKVYYSQNDIVEATDSLSDSLSYQFDTEKIVRKLIPGTRYYFRVMVYTINNVFSASNIVDTVTATGQGGTVKPVTASITNTTDSSISLKWSKYATADFKNYTVFVSPDDNVDSTDSIAFSSTSPDDTTKVLHYLQSETHYYFRIVVYNTSGKLGLSSLMDTTTPIRKNGVIVVHTPVVNSTDTSLSFSWSKSSVRFDTYKVMADTMLRDPLTLFGAIDLTDTFTTIKKLANQKITKGNTYYFKVFAYRDTITVAKSILITVTP
jgi:hypothetical protein